MKTVFITGVSSGIGYALSQLFLQEGWSVYGISRREPETLMKNKQFYFQPLDLKNLQSIVPTLQVLLRSVSEVELVILNAAMLGDIEDLSDTDIEKLRTIMNVNVWANKVICDFLFQKISIKQIAGISTGASQEPYRGWNGYAISKSAFNMLLGLYAQEKTDVHFSILIPGVIDTAMQDYIFQMGDVQKFPKLANLKNLKSSGHMIQPLEWAKRFLAVFLNLKKYPSGSTIDWEML